MFILLKFETMIEVINFGFLTNCQLFYLNITYGPSLIVIFLAWKCTR